MMPTKNGIGLHVSQVEFCECGRVWPCRLDGKNHVKFKSIGDYMRKHKRQEKFSGDSKHRQKQGQFQAKKGR